MTIRAPMQKPIFLIAIVVMFLLALSLAQAQSTDADKKVAALPKEKSIYHNGGHCNKRTTFLSGITRRLHFGRTRHRSQKHARMRTGHRNKKNW